MIRAFFLLIGVTLSSCASNITPTSSENPEKLLNKFVSQKNDIKKFEVKTIPSSSKVKKITHKKRKIKLSNITAKSKSKKSKQNVKIAEEYSELFKKYDSISQNTWSKYSFKYFENEVHKFEIDYLGITAGYATLSSLPLVSINNRSSIHLKGRMESADFYSGIYKLDDLLEVYLDQETMIPIKYTMMQRESGQTVDDLQLFDGDKNETKVFYYRFKNEKEKKFNKTVKIPKFFGDSFSPLYFSRGLPLEIGDKYEYPIVTRGKIWILRLEPVEIETIEVMDEDVEAIKVKAETRFPGILKKKGDIIFWYSNDNEKRLLKFEAKVKIGSISGELIEFQKGNLVE